VPFWPLDPASGMGKKSRSGSEGWCKCNKGNKKKTFLLASCQPLTKTAGAGSGSVPKCHGSSTLMMTDGLLGRTVMCASEMPLVYGTLCVHNQNQSKSASPCNYKSQKVSITHRIFFPYIFQPDTASFPVG
jgi:hypothetical protein